MIEEAFLGYVLQILIWESLIENWVKTRVYQGLLKFYGVKLTFSQADCNFILSMLIFLEAFLEQVLQNLILRIPK